ncbi:MAG: ABC transporter ATP-binding protein [Planctomycetes bacterium]|nr:ABC transporter ATP-binding protein [Planctomycetota bacterium]MCA8937220.1 ABC transporter ATP-binding protein [Planctomycetota bacterium]
MIEVQHVCKTFRQFRAVWDLSFSCEAGDIFGFVGPNGAGKTTTMRMMATLLDPDYGDILIDGVSVLDEPEEIRRVIGYMPDYIGVYEGVEIREYLEFFAAAYRIPPGRRKKLVDEIMEITDLTSVEKKDVATLSKGMRQRLCLAKTLVHDPKVLILDEPAAGLDPRARIELRLLLKELQKLGKTIIISSHILTELSDMCNSVGIIERGIMLTAGKIDDILADRAGGPVQQQKLFLKVLGAPDPAVTILRSLPDIGGVEIDRGLITFTFMQPIESNPGLLRELLNRNVPVVSLAPATQNLEDIFLNVTKGIIA